MGICAHECRGLQKLEESVRCPRAGVADACELPYVSAGNQAQALQESNVTS